MIEIFITGASGFIGKSLIPLLNDEGLHLYLLTRDIRKKELCGFTNKNIEWVVGNLNDAESYERYVLKSSVIINLAGEINYLDNFHKTNVDGVQTLIDVVKKSADKRIIHVSSVGVAGVQYSDRQKIVDECTACFLQNEYEQTKYAAEQILLRQIPAKRLIILRPTNVFGENHPKNHLLNLFSQLTKQKMIICSKEARVNYVYVKDVASIIKQMLLSNSCYGIYNVGTAIAMSEFLHDIIELRHSTCKVVLINKYMFNLTILLKPFLSKTTWLKLKTLNNQVVYSDRKLLEDFPYPIDLQIGLRKTIDFYVQKGLLNE